MYPSPHVMVDGETVAHPRVRGAGVGVGPAGGAVGAGGLFVAPGLFVPPGPLVAPDPCEGEAVGLPLLGWLAPGDFDLLLRVLADGLGTDPLAPADWRAGVSPGVAPATPEWDADTRIRVPTTPKAINSPKTATTAMMPRG